MAKWKQDAELIDAPLPRPRWRDEAIPEDPIERAKMDPLSAPSPLASVATGVVQAVGGMVSTGLTPFAPDVAAEISAELANLSEARRQRIKESGKGTVSKWVHTHLPGAVRSITQATATAPLGGVTYLGRSLALAGGFTATGGTESYHEGLRAGMSKAEAARYGAVAGMLEGGIMLAFQGLGRYIPGLGGMEEAFTGQMAKQTARELLKDVPVRVAAEFGEEELTEILQAFNTAAQLPGAEDAANWQGEDGTFWTSPMWQVMQDTASQTLLTMGLVETATGASYVARLKAIRATEPKNLKREAAKVGITGTRSEVRKKLDEEIKQAEKEIKDAQEVPGTEGEVRETEGGEDLRGVRPDEVGTEQEGQGTEAQEVPVEPQAPPVAPQPSPEVSHTELARRAARGEDVGRPEGVSEGRWVAMVDQMRKRMGLKPKPVTPQPSPEATPALEAPTPTVAPETPRDVQRQETYEYTPLNVDDDADVSSRVWRHGTKADLRDLKNVDPTFYGSVRNLFGNGLYLTDSPQIARGYAGESGQVLETSLKSGVKLLDFSQPLPSEAFDIIANAAQFDDQQRESLRESSGEDIFKEMQEMFEDEMMTEGDVVEIYQNLAGNLESAGFDGIRYEGGRRTRKGRQHGPHNVVVLFPDNLYVDAEGNLGGRRLADKLQTPPEATPAQQAPTPPVVPETPQEAVQRPEKRRGRKDQEGAVQKPGAELEKAGIGVRKTDQGWTVTGISKEQFDAIKDENPDLGARKRGRNFTFKKDPSEWLATTAEEILEENQQVAAAEASGLVRTRIGTLTPEQAEWYEQERASRLKLAQENISERNADVSELIAQVIPPKERGAFRKKMRAVEDPRDDRIEGDFNILLQYTRDHPELAWVPETEAELFDMLRDEALRKDDTGLEDRIDDELALKYESYIEEELAEAEAAFLAELEEEAAIDAIAERESAAEEPTQAAIPGFEQEAASVQKAEEVKRAREQRREEAGPPGKQQALFPKKGLAGQKNLFADTGVPEEMVGEPKPKGKGPGGSAMAAMTEGDSYQPVQPERTKEPTPPPVGRPPAAKPNAKSVVSDIVGIASPAHVSDISREAGHLMREEMARAAQWDEAAREALRGMERTFWLMSPEDSYEFIDRLESGEKQATPELDAIAKAIRTQLDKGRDRLQAIGKLKDFYQDYFPHLWKNPTHAQDVIRSISAGKPWRSSPFLKRRTHITHKEGRDAGLIPISDSPIEMALLRLHQVNKYVARTNTMERLKQAGLMKFVPESFDKSYMPSGYEYYDDPAFRVVSDPSITMEEAYDKLLVDQLSAVLNRLGVDHKRVAKMSHGKWGASKGKGITTRFAGPVSVMAHELGHQIGETWGLFDYLTKGAPVEGRRFKTGKRAGQEVKADARRKRAQMQRELRALADLRVEGQPTEVVEGTKQYRRKKVEKEAVILEAWLAAPDKMAEVAPMVTEAWKDFLSANEPVTPLLNLDRSVVLGTREQLIPQRGVLHLGKWAMPSDVARMVKNMLSPGLRSNPNRAVKGLYRLARIMGNAMNQASLSLSGFHALNVLTDASASQIGLAIQQMERGRIGRAVWNLATAPLAGTVGTFRGGRLIRAMRSDVNSLSPEIRAFVEDGLTAGARASMDPVYHNHAIREVAKSIRKLRYGSALKKVDASVRLPIQMTLGALEMTAKPIMEWMVPRMKLHVFYSLAQDVHDRANQEGLNDFQIREQLSQAWDSVDNRLGQLAYDNLFWNMYLKDVSMLAIRSVGWNLGSFREYGGAVLDVANTRARLRHGDQLISRKIGYAIGAVATYAPLGALIMYAFTGDWPEELKDYFFPKTGRTNPDGSPERLSLPTYAKDWIAWTTRPGTVAKHKLHPMWGTMADVFTNENYYGVKIRNEDDPWYAQLEDTMTHIAGSFVPFSIKNMDRFIKAGEDPKLAVPMALSGITSAPAYISRSPAQKLAYDLMIGNIPQGSRTKEQAEASEKRKDLVKRMRGGGTVTDEEIKQYSKQQMKLIEKEAKQTPFQIVVGRLHDEQAMKVWALAKGKEKEQIRDPLKFKFIAKMTVKAEGANELNRLEQARMYLDQLGVSSYEDSQKLLMDYFWQVQDGEMGDEFAGNNFKVGYERAAIGLDKLYGKPEGEFEKWRQKAGYTDQWEKKRTEFSTASP